MMKKLIKLRQFLEIVNKIKQKNIKLNVEGKFNNQGKFCFQIKNIEVDKKLAEELGFKQVIIDKGDGMQQDKKPKQPTIREMLGTVIKKVDSIDKRLFAIENTPTMKKELVNSKKLTL